MLTDYHLHLRPDDESATAADYFTESNVDQYLAAASEAGVEELVRVSLGLGRLRLDVSQTHLRRSFSGERNSDHA